jgi:hypothetical protein
MRGENGRVKFSLRALLLALLLLPPLLAVLWFFFGPKGYVPYSGP